MPDNRKHEPLTDQELEPPSWETLLVRLCEEMVLLRKEKRAADVQIAALAEALQEVLDASGTIFHPDDENCWVCQLRGRTRAALTPDLLRLVARQRALERCHQALKRRISEVLTAKLADDCADALDAVAACEETP